MPLFGASFTGEPVGCCNSGCKKRGTALLVADRGRKGCVRYREVERLPGQPLVGDIGTVEGERLFVEPLFNLLERLSFEQRSGLLHLFPKVPHGVGGGDEVAELAGLRIKGEAVIEGLDPLADLSLPLF